MGPMVLASQDLGPGLVIDVSDSLAPRSDDAGVVEEDVNGLPVEFCGRRPDARGLRDIHSQDPQFLVAVLRQSA